MNLAGGQSTVGTRWLAGSASHTFAAGTSPNPCRSAAECRQTTPPGTRATSSARPWSATLAAVADLYVPRDTCDTSPAATARLTVAAVTP